MGQQLDSKAKMDLLTKRYVWDKSLRDTLLRYGADKNFRDNESRLLDESETGIRSLLKYLIDNLFIKDSLIYEWIY